MNRPYISVIVPTYNAEDYIQRCLDSLQQQTLQNIEIVIVDDGSTDNTASIIDRYASQDFRFKAFHIQNHGVAYARQFGLEKVTGEYVIHADADDWLDHNLLETLYQKANTTNADFVLCDFCTHLSNSCEKHTLTPESLSQDIFFQNLLLIRYSSALWNKLIRRKLFDDYNITFDTSMTTSEDFFVLCQVFEHPIKIEYVSNVFYHYDKTINPNSITQKKIPWSHIQSQIKCIKYLESHFDTVLYKEGIECRKVVLKQLMWDGGFWAKKTMVDIFPEVNKFFNKGKKDRFGLYDEKYYIFNSHYYLGMFLYYFRKWKRKIKRQLYRNK